MSFVVPGGELYLFKGVPLDNNYEDVFRFPSGLSSADIGGHFLNAFKYTHTTDMGNLSYQRVDNQTFKVDVPAWEHYDDNYLMFRNNGNNRGTYGYDRWYFGFITDVLYINDHCTQFTYEIDWITTWLPYCKFEDCFIDRCTPETDNVGDNIIPEKIECADYLFSNRRNPYPIDDSLILSYINPDTHNKAFYSETYDISQYNIPSLAKLETFIMVCEVDDNDEISSVDGSLIENTYSGATIYFTMNDEVAAVDEFISKYLKHPNAIINMYRAPAYSAAAYIKSGIAKESDVENIYKIGRFTNMGSFLFFYNYEDNSVSNGTASFGNYYPINKKLYTYPYNYISVDNGCGEHMDLRYEFWNKNNDNISEAPIFIIEMSVIPPVQIRIIPYQYGFNIAGSSDQYGYNFQNQLVMEQYPTCSWNTDYYAAWLAQNSVPIAVNVGTSLLGGAVQGVTGFIGSLFSANPLNAVSQTANTVGSGISGALQGASDLFSEYYAAKIHEDNYYGNLSAGNLNNAQLEANFSIQRANITENLARSIDNFFSMFGYAQKIVTNPYDILDNNGQYYCYIKTEGCQAGGEIPSKARDMIEKIFNKGVRFWDFDKGEYGDLGNVLDYCEHNNTHHNWSIA